MTLCRDDAGFHNFSRAAAVEGCPNSKVGRHSGALQVRHLLGDTHANCSDEGSCKLAKHAIAMLFIDCTANVLNVVGTVHPCAGRLPIAVHSCRRSSVCG